MAATKCPHCFGTINPAEVVFVCTGSCPETEDVELTRAYGSARRLRTLTAYRPAENDRKWQPPASGVCRTCQHPTSTEVCPSCHFVLPDHWRGSGVTCIAFAGARATGKSIYLGVVVRLLEHLATALGTTVAHVTPASRRVYQTTYERPLYEARGLLPPTPRALAGEAPHREPIILGFGVLNGQRRYLVLRDVAGEDLESDDDKGWYLQFFAQASLVLFLFDPTHVREIADQIRDLVPAQNLTGGDPVDVLDNVLALVGAGQPRIGIAMSKFDTMQVLRSMPTAWGRVMANTGAAFNRDFGSDQGSYDDSDGELLHTEVRSLLIRLNAGRVVGVIERPHAGPARDYRFFAVSALGNQPDSSGLNAHGIAPFRVLDPIRWALATDGAIPLVNVG